LSQSTASLTRKEFLLTVGGVALLPEVLQAKSASGKLLILVAHPDDEYAFAGATYRLVRELGWIADQITITDGESGNRYAALAEAYYGVTLTKDARVHLPGIRREEALRAGKVLGIREHHFLDQKDLGFDTKAAAAESTNWDRALIRGFLSEKLEREKYDLIFTLLPTAETHGHHLAATLPALETVSRLPLSARPLVFGAEARSADARPMNFSGLPEHPLTRTVDAAPDVVFDRRTNFGYRGALNYQIVVNWVIAEHKSQGMFQNDYGKHSVEDFWLFEASGATALARLPSIRALLSPTAQRAAAG